jgi:hypothetical protein
MKRKKKTESIEVVEVLPSGERKKIRLKDIDDSAIMSREIKLWYKKFYSEKHKKDIKGFG